jgi:hypothetical protein
MQPLKKKTAYGLKKLTIDQMFSNRQIANTAGHSHYFLNKPCKHGHIAPRSVSSTSCVECDRIRKREPSRLRKRNAAKKRAVKMIMTAQKEKTKTFRKYGLDKLEIKQMESNKKNALKLGHSHYFTGKFCKKGHLAPRTTKNATCVMCTRLYSKNWALNKNH